jgi:hypothetical protein
MAKKKKIYLVWQCSGSSEEYSERLCGVYDTEEKALELKDKLDRDIIWEDTCWTVMPEEVFCQWPTIDNCDSDGCDFAFAEEYRGYTREQRDHQDERWIRMIKRYHPAEIQLVEMNEEIELE